MFITPLLIYGTALASVPILIHLLNKRRFKPMRWAAMEFLLKALKKNTRRIQIRDLILMLIRAAAVALLALTLARPIISAQAGFWGGRRTGALILLDTSLSMDYSDGRETRFDRAKRLTKRLLNLLEEEENALTALMTFNDGPHRPLGDPPQNIGYLLKEMDRAIARPTGAAVYRTDAGTDLEGVLRQALTFFEQAPEYQGANRELYVITDMQAAPWLRLRESDAVRELLRKLNSLASVYLVNAGDEGGANAALESLTVADDPLAVGLETEIAVTVRNFGEENLAGLTADLFVDPTGETGERPTARRSLDVPAGGRASATFRHTFSTGGERRLEARLSDDRLAADNVRRAVVRVIEEKRILILDGRERRFDDPLSTATPYLRRALAPRDAQQPEALKPLRADVVSAKRFFECNLNDYEIAALADVGGLSEDDALALAKRVREGLGLMIFLGDNTDAEEYRRLFGPEGADILPADIGAPFGEKPKPDDEKLPPARRLSAEYVEHLIMADFKDVEMRELLNAAHFWRAFDLKPWAAPRKPRSPATEEASAVAVAAVEDAPVIVAKFDNGKTAVVEQKFGLGRVILFAFPATTDWSTFPKQYAFPIMLFNAAKYLAAGGKTEANLHVNEPLRGRMDLADIAAAVSLQGPETIGRRALTPVGDADGRASFVFEQTDAAGFYEVCVETVPPRKSAFAVNPAAAEESDPQPLKPAELRKHLPDFQFVFIAQGEDLGKKLADERKGVELWPWLIAGVFLLLLTESVLAHLWAPKE
jgi:hypothetical protein